MIRIVILDDEKLIAEAIGNLITQNNHFEIVDKYSSPSVFLEKIKKYNLIFYFLI